MLDSTDNTFVTAVFNGSTSLRNAAGELIEDVAKSVRRKKTVDDSYIDKLFDSVTSLYRLDQIKTEDQEESELDSKNLGPLPAGSVWLIIILAFVWIMIGIAAGVRKLKSRKKDES